MPRVEKDRKYELHDKRMGLESKGTRIIQARMYGNRLFSIDALP